MKGMMNLRMTTKQAAKMFHNHNDNVDSFYLKCNETAMVATHIQFRYILTGA
jgi:hypothetical protein